MYTATSNERFQQRTNVARPFEDIVWEAYSTLPDITAVVKNGVEHVHPTLVEHLRTNTTPAALFVRYAPDGLALFGKSGRLEFFEAKCSDTIERAAYETYMAYHRNGCAVRLWFQDALGQIYHTRVEELKFLDSDEIVAGFPPEKRFPVVDGWITPRDTSYRPEKNMSGTPYRKVDFSQMKRYRTRGER